MRGKLFLKDLVGSWGLSLLLMRLLRSLCLPSSLFTSLLPYLRSAPTLLNASVPAQRLLRLIAPCLLRFVVPPVRRMCLLCVIEGAFPTGLRAVAHRHAQRLVQSCLFLELSLCVHALRRSIESAAAHGALPCDFVLVVLLHLGRY